MCRNRIPYFIIYNVNPKSEKLKIKINKRERGRGTHKLGPVPALKFAPPFPILGQGVTPLTVLPNPGNSVHVTPLTLVFRLACPASIDTPPSPSTNPLNPSGTLPDEALK